MKRLVLAAGLCAVLAGCSTSRDAQLEAVARDWCMTIRASQIIPVYPLTEDLQPGDVFLVQVPIDQQQVVYKKKGFLALDNHLARLHPDGYGDFYERSFLQNDLADKNRLPGVWLRPSGELKYWEPAPNAAFPSYSFSTSHGAGFNLAIPISGVPVGLSLMGSQSANGSVTIGKTHTLGVDITSLHKKLCDWAKKHRADLAPFGTPVNDDSRRNYLRVITRVYATGRVDIALSDSRSYSGGADVGVPRPVDLIAAKAPTSMSDTGGATIDNYNRNLANLNAGLAESLRPTRVSGSNAGLSVEEIDAKTEASRAASKKYEEAAETELETKKTDLATKEREAAPKLKAEAEAKKALDEKSAEAAAAKAASVRASDDVDSKKTAHERAVKAHGEGSQEAAAAKKDLDDAVKAQAKAETDRKDAEDAAGKALAAYTKAHDDAQTPREAVATAQGGVDAARAALGTLTQVLPGGSLRVTSASSRFITMQQDFNPPLVIGYLGFDVAIYEGGLIGPPIPTHARLDPGEVGQANAVPGPANLLSGDLGVILDLHREINARPDAAAIYGDAARRLGNDWVRVYDKMQTGDSAGKPEAAFGALQLAYQSVPGATEDERNATIRDALKAALDEAAKKKK